MEVERQKSNALQANVLLLRAEEVVVPQNVEKSEEEVAHKLIATSFGVISSPHRARETK